MKKTTAMIFAGLLAVVAATGAFGAERTPQNAVDEQIELDLERNHHMRAKARGRMQRFRPVEVYSRDLRGGLAAEYLRGHVRDVHLESLQSRVDEEFPDQEVIVVPRGIRQEREGLILEKSAEVR